MSKKRSIALAGLAGAAFLLACESAPKATTRPATAPGTAGPTVKAVPSGKLVPPPFIDPATLMPRRGEELAKARLKLDQIVAALPTPPSLAPTTRPASQPATRPATRPATASAAIAAEPPLPAQRAYFLGRMAWRDRRGPEAINYLQSAERLAPGHPPILRLLGEIYGAMGNKIRSAYYFEQAVSADPTDPESLFVVGRIALDQGKWEHAVVYFSRALGRPQTPGIDPGIWPFLRYSLAGALERAGYDAAAIEQYRACLDAPPPNAQTTRLARELLFLSRQRNYLWLSIGDALNRLDDPGAAFAAYAKAGDLAGEDPVLLGGRLAYTQIRLHKRDAAQETALAALRASKANPQAIELLQYAKGDGAASAAYAQRVVQVYEELDRPGPLAVAISQFLGGASGQAFLEKHLAAKPQDAGVGEQMIRQSLVATSSRSPAALAPSLRIAISAVSASPAYARRFALVLVEEGPEPSVLLPAFDALAPAERVRPAAHYLRGRLLDRENRPEEAAAAYAAAIESEPSIPAARVELIRQHVERRRFDQAEELLKPLAESHDADLMALRIGILAETKRAPEALKLLDQRLAQQPLNVDLLLQKATLQRATGDVAGAERSLLDALDARPQEERLYEALFDLYESPQAGPDASQQYQRLMRRLQRTIPQSRIARLMLAEWLAANSQQEQAEKSLRGLIAENPRDYKAIATLAEVLSQAGRQPEAATLIDQSVAKAPRDARMLQVAIDHFRRVGDRPKLIATVERRLQLDPVSPERAQRLASLYMQDKRPGEAVKVLSAALADKAIKEPRPLVALLAQALLAAGQPDEADRQVKDAINKYPGHEIDLTFQWAMHLERRGRREESEKVMVEIVEKHPDHAMTNNALGYAWAEKGKNLKRAKAMLVRAVESEPDNAAYLDSLGWACYKLGEFPDAVKWLKRSLAAPGGDYPVILDHLADALFRGGDRPQALQNWRRALERVREGSVTEEEDPEIKGLAERLTQKIQAAEQGRQPTLAPVPGRDGAPPDPAAAQAAP